MLFNSTQDGPAQLVYGPNSYRIVRPGTYVLCAVSEAEIPLQQLTYWSAERQEAYATAEFATQRLTQPE